jgi:hypothetical protein
MKKSQFLGIVSVTLLTFSAIAAPAFSQEKRVEINPFFGYSFSDGVTVDPIPIGGEIYDEVNPKSGMIADTQYSNQFEISGGLSLRF